MKTFYLITFVGFFAFIGSNAWAQQNFVPLKPGEYVVEHAPEPENKDAVITGRYSTTYEGKRVGSIGGRDGAGQMVYEFELGFRSQVHDMVSLNATLANFSDLSKEQPSRYWSDYSVEEWDASTDTGMNLIFKESFLEYAHNPSAILRLGRQKFNIGARLGLIYKGIASGVSQTCRVGTWCTYAGSAKLGKGSADNLSFAQLTYPVYENGLEVKDPFSGEIHQAEGLYIELFRSLYQGSKVPLGTFGGRTTNGSTAQAKTAEGKPVYFDNKKTEYFGLNGLWYLPKLELRLHYIANAGDRNYWAGEGYDQYIGQQHVTGHLWYFRDNYQWLENTQIGFDYFTATGDPSHNSNTPVWQRDLSGYNEIQKGYFGNALIYFQGQQQTGQGHTVNNLTFQNVHFEYKDKGLPWKFEVSAYQFQKSNAVTDENGMLASVIGREIDVLYSNQIETNLNFTFGYAIFSPDSAYSASDNLQATGGKTFSSVSTQLNYHF